ncbi:MAG: hypothetical protein JWL71_3986 [Acidobacteria bacterium]|nr:hypothetical protein [Acidobacteriota bacterium]
MIGARPALAALLSCLVLVPASAQHAHGSSERQTLPVDLLDRPVPLRHGMGAVHEAVSTTSGEAQAFYDQGLAYLHAFVWIEAARSFHQALRIDSRLAMAQLGLSYAEGELNRPAEAGSALERARELAKESSDRERLRITLRGLELDAIAHPRDPGRLTMYRRGLDEAIVHYPRDTEMWLLRGMAESPSPGDRGQGAPAGSTIYFERVLAIDPDSPAAHHYLTHALESAGRIDEALQHGCAFATLAPAVPHARHMYGHDLRRVGRADEAIAEFLAADALETDYARSERIPIDADWHHQHNLDLMATSFQYVGQMKSAELRFREAFAIASPLTVEEFAKREWPAFLIDRGRWDEAIAAAGTMIAHPSPIVATTGHILTGAALLSAGRLAEAADRSNTALRTLKGISQGAGLVTPSFEELQGEFFLRTGQRDKGRAMLARVVTTLRRQTGPDEWIQALFTLQAIARTAREVGDWELAANVARQMFGHDRWFAGTHYAAALCAVHAGDHRRARAEFSLARQYWHGADRDLPELRITEEWLSRNPR